MRYSFRGFTLIELIVAVTISTVLMSSVMFFITSGIKNISIQKSTLENTKDQDMAIQQLYNAINGAENKSQLKTFSSGALVKIQKNLYTWGFMYIWEKQKRDYYCNSWSTIRDTNHLVTFPFIPFEGEWGDIFTGVSTDVSSIQTKFFSGSIMLWATKLLWDYTSPTGVASFGVDRYIADTGGHQILKYNITTPAVAWVRVVGLWVSWDSMQEGKNGNAISLNSPTWLAVWEWKLFISDTLNNRILYYDIVTSRIYTLLWSEAWLDEPTWLYYDSIQKALYISNSGKWQILRYQSLQVVTPPSLTLSITPGRNVLWVDNFSLDFFTTSSTLSANPTFTGFNSWADYFTGTTDRFDYYFTDFLTLESSSGDIPIAWCSWRTSYFLEFGNLKKEVQSCSTAATWSVDKYSGTLNTDLLAGNTYQIQFNNIVGTFTGTKTYYVKLGLFDGDTKVREEYFPYFVNGDWLVTTTDNNTLTVFASGLSYPTGIYKSGANMVVHDFIERKRKSYDQITGAFVWETALANFDFPLIDAYGKDILKLPLKQLDVQLSGNLLHLNLEYFKVFSCEGEASESTTRSVILKKFVK